MSFCGSSLASAVQHQAEHKRPGQSCVGIPHLKPQFISYKPSPKLSFHLNRQSRSMYTGKLNWKQKIFQLPLQFRNAGVLAQLESTVERGLLNGSFSKFR